MNGDTAVSSPSTSHIDKENDREAKPVEAREQKLTIFADPENFTIKHPLQNRWTMWFDNPGKKATQQSWHENLKKVLTFDTVEDFWRLFNNIVPASKLSSGSNYHLFKENIEPKWEDPANENGGKWVLNLPNKNRAFLDQYWLWTLLAVVGENLSEENEICGVVVSIRKQQDKIALWTRTSMNEATALGIGKRWRALLEYPEKDPPLGFQSHEDCMRRNSSYNNRNRYEC